MRSHPVFEANLHAFFPFFFANIFQELNLAYFPMTKPGLLSPKTERKTSRMRRHSIDGPQTLKIRGRILTGRKSRTRIFSLPLADDEMYFSEPELVRKGSKSPRLFPVRALTVSQTNSLTVSEDEDGALFKTLTSELGDHIKESGSGKSGLSSPKMFTPIHVGESTEIIDSLNVVGTIQAELEGVPETALESRIPKSVLSDYAKLPLVIECVINHGIFSCLSCLLYELTFMPVSAFRGVRNRLSGASPRMSWIEYTDLLRTLILIVSVVVFNVSIDFSAVYHYIRAQSLLKLYFIFNAMEIIERLVRSWGNDLVDGLMRSAVVSTSSVFSVVGHWIVVLVYTLVHTYIHFWRVMIISVAILANDIMIVLVTNNFGELKTAVFKKNDQKSTYPILSSDVVERLYLFIDVALMAFRMVTSPQRSKIPFGEVSFWITLMVGLEILTDWIKFLCLSKFNLIDNKTYWHYQRIHREDLINSRNADMNPVPPLAHKGYISASHLPARRMNFMPTPLAVLLLCNLMLPNLVGADALSLWGYRVLVVCGLFLLKLTVDWVLVGDAVNADRTEPIPEKLQNIKSH